MAALEECNSRPPQSHCIRSTQATSFPQTLSPHGELQLCPFSLDFPTPKGSEASILTLTVCKEMRMLDETSNTSHPQSRENVCILTSPPPLTITWYLF